ncbi:PDR/VanB family oxidoreductase [[Mycobacterium] wendilense]|uniref:PDR/VanB family oxidoreductase n=1 Tax=[Mycobacterium] wendilense TaxID=3064284 RepID=A0ABM9M8N5_9MYCO|nr:PDR/VanB family oxidoreductase [Mycolicibacterium sp. MU0050]CAJ1579089.1 PDR/VanB family oxidoreductase [Mycolicibacterium sp. MU0050]
MTRLVQRLKQTPPSLSGRFRHDPAIRFADLAINGLWAVTGAVARERVSRRAAQSLTLRVAERTVVAHDQDVIELRLVAAAGQPLPVWHAGAHIDVHLPSGRIRQYSLCGDPAVRDHYRIAVRRIPGGGGGSVEIHDRLPVGATVETLGPRNAFPLAVPGYGSPAQRFRFIAGGIGITPILSMLTIADQLGVNWSMAYVGRSRDSLPFLDEIARYGDRVEIRTDDVHGLPTAGALLGDCPDGTAVYTCGPAPMLGTVRSALADRDKVELHYERFGAAPVVDGEPFQATLAASGKTVQVGADETLLHALTRAGVPAPYSCQQGFCGTCRTRVLAGEVDHRDTLLTEPERADQMLTCVSRSAAGTPLTLDL